MSLFWKKPFKSLNHWWPNRLFFDLRDHDLIRIVNDLYDSPSSLGYTRKVYYPFFHPLGIKELAESKGLRMAYCLVHLLNSLERGDEDNRIQALQGLRAEVIDTRTGPMPLNSARVLLQLMKMLVRARGDYARQLELAHDFRKTASGQARHDPPAAAAVSSAGDARSLESGHL